ncbi:MAG: hypothetical protein IEMM0002_1221 [bacterium]|nr:MAG: hypothetical protein IEMM0002_1221 [bacterium]
MEYFRIKRYAGIASLLLPFAFFACLVFLYPSNAAAADPAAQPILEETEYVIGPEDVLEISVWKNEDLTKVVLVRPDGMITLPLVGDLRAADRTPSELRDVIIERLKQYQKTVTVSVILQEVNSYRIFIVGQVVAPGTYQLRRRTTLVQAIALAGGFNEFASKNKIVVIREKSGDKKTQKIKVRFKDIVNVKKDNDNNLILIPGDTIFVP